MVNFLAVEQLCFPSKCLDFFNSFFFNIQNVLVYLGEDIPKTDKNVLICNLWYINPFKFRQESWWEITGTHSVIQTFTSKLLDQCCLVRVHLLID